MKPLSEANIESELSYAYLHAVASHAGMGCRLGSRHEDNAGVDATLVAWGPFAGSSYRKEVDLKIQLKATVRDPAEIDGCYSYSFSGIAQYDDLRSDAVATPRILVVLFLPPTNREWITHSQQALSLHRCAYWVSLRGAPESTNRTSQTVYLPKHQVFDVTGLKTLVAEVARNAIPVYRGLEI